MYGLHRAMWTLIGAAGTLLLVWTATLPQEHTTGGYWATYGLIAAGGLALALSQIVGGWTKYGWPRISGAVFAIGFLPTLVVSAWILIVTQHHGGWEQGRLSRWSGDLGISHFIQSVGPYKAAFALTFGLVLGFCFDTSGPRRRVTGEPVATTAVAPNDTVADEPIARERRGGFLRRRDKVTTE
jgi:drug/metabolite transporter superfamily protein YnfA